MLYRPDQGAMWDPSILWWNGHYHAFMMYSRDTGNGLEAGHCIKAISPDGVHWRTDAVVIEEPERTNQWKFFKCFVGRCGDRFIMDHGIARPEGQDMLRFYESADMIHWKLLFSSRPDPRWYGLPPEMHRWDHMYILPKEEGNPKAGFWGHPVSAPKPFDRGGVGMMQSPDGLAWEVLPPAPIEFPAGMPAFNHLEWGGCERLGGKYYLIGGGGYLGSKGYGMYWLSADKPAGPFRIDPDAPRLCGNSHLNLSWLAVWCRGKDERLISNYASPVPGDLAPWLLPLRKPVLDPKGRLRLGWWKGNEALKGAEITAEKRDLSIAGTNGVSIHDAGFRFNEERGIVVEGRIRATAKGANPGAGPALFEPEGKALAMLLGVGTPGSRETQTGRVNTADGRFELMDSVGPYSACVTGIEDGQEHAFRLLSRIGLFELYVDDLLVQTFFYKRREGRIGFGGREAEIRVTGLKAWNMSL